MLNDSHFRLSSLTLIPICPLPPRQPLRHRRPSPLHMRTPAARQTTVNSLLCEYSPNPISFEPIPISHNVHVFTGFTPIQGYVVREFHPKLDPGALTNIQHRRIRCAFAGVISV